MKIGLVLFGESGEIDGGLWEVDSLSGRESTRVEGLDSEPFTLNGDDLEGEDTVIDVDELAGRGDLDNVFLKISSKSECRRTGQLT